MIHLDCPRFDSCNAALCPLQPDWRQVQHLPGEQVCFYARESGKVGAAERHAADPAFAAVIAVLPQVMAKHPDIGRRVEVAAKTGSKGANLRRKPAVEAA